MFKFGQLSVRAIGLIRFQPQWLTSSDDLICARVLACLVSLERSNWFSFAHSSGIRRSFLNVGSKLD
jgi:hypothetical protein